MLVRLRITEQCKQQQISDFVCILSGTTVTLSIVAAAGTAAVTFPPSSIQARVGLSMAVSSAAVVASALAVLSFTTMHIDAEIAVAVISAAAMSVAFAAAWAVGVMVMIFHLIYHLSVVECN